MSAPYPRISDQGRTKLVAILQEAASVLPGNGLTICSPEKVIFEHYEGKVDVLDTSETAKVVNKNTIMFFASTTKLLTSIAILQLIEKGVITLDTPMSTFFPELKPPLRIIDSFSSSGEPRYRTTEKEITIKAMLNQSSGFGQEFGDKVTLWKKSLPDGAKGKGFVNSCKIDNLIHTPLTEEPGTTYQYGNSAEWLGLLIQKATGASLEDYMKENIFGPLGMKNTSFIPFENDQAERLMPLRWYDVNSRTYEVLVDQFPGLTLPRKTAEIEYGVGGGGVYSTVSDYILVLRDILSAFVEKTTSKVLSESSIKSLFTPTLSETAKEGLTRFVGARFHATEVGELDWSTAMCLYLKDGRKGGWGRNSGSAGWAGAGGTEYWIDPAAKIACVWSPNLLPSSAPIVSEIKEKVERAVYEALEI